MHSPSMLLPVLLLLLATSSAATDYVICSSSEDTRAGMAKMSVNLTSNIPGDSWTSVVADGLAGCRDMLRAGSANMFETDAGKAFGIVLDSTANKWSTEAVPIGKVGTGYTTMAVIRKAKLVSDGIDSFCDIVDKGTWRAAHTGYMKSAGWVSPMGELQDCAQSRPALAAVCADLTKTGLECHQAAFAGSCVPGAPGGVAGVCEQCETAAGGATCAKNDNIYYNVRSLLFS